jgi:hypothetical protein
VFVGTSFSVNITNIALTQARDRGLPVFNFNLSQVCQTSQEVPGDSVERLIHLVCAGAERRGQAVQRVERAGSGGGEPHARGGARDGPQSPLWARCRPTVTAAATGTSDGKRTGRVWVLVGTRRSVEL